MSETTVLLLAILIAAAVMALSTALSLAGVAPRTTRKHVSVLPVSVLCPETNDVAFAQLGYDWDTGRLGLTSCERFPTGAFECDRECLPTRILTPGREPATSAA